MWKSLAFATLLALAISPAKKEQRSDLAKHDSDNNGTPAAVSFVNNETPTPNQQCSCAETPPWWKRPEWWLCILGVPTLLFLGWQAKETRKAAEAAEMSVAQEKDFFIQSQRPKLVVSAFYLKSPSGETPAGLRRVDGSWYSGQFCITNTGSTEATVKKVLCVCLVLDSLPAKQPWEGQHGCEVNFSLHPGASKPYAFTIESQPTEEGDVGAILTQHRNLYAMGWIDYEDASCIRRTTRFCRRYDTKTGRFWPIENDPDYEGQD